MYVIPVPSKNRDNQRQAQRRHYQSNKEYYAKKREIRTKKIREWALNYKMEKSCVSCGESHPACLEFHHTDQFAKDLDISLAIQKGWGIKRLEQELVKCVVLCANCHRKPHWEDKTRGLNLKYLKHSDAVRSTSKTLAS